MVLLVNRDFFCFAVIFDVYPFWMDIIARCEYGVGRFWLQITTPLENLPVSLQPALVDCLHIRT